MANESAAEVELEQRIESVLERVLERHLQHLSQPSTKPVNPQRELAGVSYSLPCGMMSRRWALTKEIGTGTGR